MRKFLDSFRKIGAWCVKHKAVTALTVAVVLLSIPLRYAFADFGDFMDFATSPIDSTMLLLAGIIQVLTGGIGKLTLLLIQSIVIPILGYNGFYNSHITNLGWSLVRDVVNMFVVVVLIVIAMMTVIGYEKANWTQQLPKLFISIVLVNFSKLICGFLIDISQVIMFTFVNAIVSIAAGNFAAMLSLNTYGQFAQDFIVTINKNGSGIEAFQFLVSAYLQFIILLGVLGVIFLLAAAFVWRIIILWIVIIMSPLAFFMIGVKDIFHAAESSYKEWWKKFTSALMFGPIMVFFLWLALAASSGSNLAQTEDFPMPESQTDSGIPLTMFELDNFLGMFLALAILLGGMQQASASAAGMGGFASKLLSDGVGAGILKGLAGGYGLRGAKSALTGFADQRKWADEKIKKGATGLGKFAPTFTKNLGNDIAKIGTKMAAGGGTLASVAGGVVGGLGASIGAGSKAASKEKLEKGGGLLDAYTDDQMAAVRERAGGELSSDPVTKAADLAYRKKLLTDQIARSKHRDEMEKKQLKIFESNKYQRPEGETRTAKELAKEAAGKEYDKTMASVIGFSKSDDGKNMLALSADEREKVDDMLAANAHLIEPEDKSVKRPGQEGYDERVHGAAYRAAKQSVIEAKFLDMHTKGRLNPGTFSVNAIKDPTAGAAMKNFKYPGKDGKPTTVWNEIEEGRGTIPQRDAAIGLITAADVGSASAETRKKSVAALVKADAVVKEDVDGKGVTRRVAVAEAIRNTAPTDYSPKVYGKAAASLLDGFNDDGVTPMFDSTDVLGDAVSTLAQGDGDTSSAQFQRVSALLESDAKSVRHLDIDENRASSASAVATSKVNLEQIKRLQDTSNEDSANGTRAAQALKVMERAVHAEMGREDITDDRKKTLKRMADGLGTGDRYARKREAGNAGSSDVDDKAARKKAKKEAKAAAAGAGPDEEFMNGKGGAARPAPEPSPAPVAPKPVVIRQVRGSGTPAPAPSAAPAPAPAPFKPAERPPLRFQDEPTPAPDSTGGRYNTPSGGTGGGDPFR